MKRKVNLKDGRTIYRYSDSFKQQVLESIKQGRMTKNEASRHYGVSIGSIYEWVKKFSSFDLYNPQVTIRMPHEKDQVKALKEQIAELKEAMVQSQLKAIKAESDLEVALEMFGLEKSEFEKKREAPHLKSPSKKSDK